MTANIKKAVPFGQINACGGGVGNRGNPLILQILVQTLIFIFPT